MFNGQEKAVRMSKIIEGILITNDEVTDPKGQLIEELEEALRKLKSWDSFNARYAMKFEVFELED